ncbi:hypothetical protein [Leptotrichia trevisanii]|nr:hypothetical protein [Leptotrichia trevisanii]
MRNSIKIFEIKIERIMGYYGYERVTGKINRKEFKYFSANKIYFFCF